MLSALQNPEMMAESFGPRFREHMLRPEAYPVGWSSRRYFPARAPRQAVPALDPTNQQPAQKRPNMGQGPSGEQLQNNKFEAKAPPF